MIDRQMRIVAEHLSRIQQVVRIENRFDLLEDSVKLAVLRPEECRARQSKSMFSADRTSHGKCSVIKLAGQIFHPARIRRGWQEGSHVHLPRRGMRIQRRSDLVLLQNAARSCDEFGQRLGRDCDVFDDWQRRQFTARSIEKWDHPIGQRPEEFDFVDGRCLKQRASGIR